MRHRVVEYVHVYDSRGRLSGSVVIFSGTDAEEFLVHESLAFRSWGAQKDELSVGRGEQGKDGGFHGDDVHFLRLVDYHFGGGEPTDVSRLVVEGTEMATGSGIQVLYVVLAILVQEHRVRAVLGLESRYVPQHVVLYDVGRGLLESHDYPVVVRQERVLGKQLREPERFSHLSGTVYDYDILRGAEKLFLPRDMDWGAGFRPGGNRVERKTGNVSDCLPGNGNEGLRGVGFFLRDGYERVQAVEFMGICEKVGFAVGEVVGMEIDVFVLGKGDVVGGLGKEIVVEKVVCFLE